MPTQSDSHALYWTFVVRTCRFIFPLFLHARCINCVDLVSNVLFRCSEDTNSVSLPHRVASTMLIDSHYSLFHPEHSTRIPHNSYHLKFSSNIYSNDRTSVRTSDMQTKKVNLVELRIKFENTIRAKRQRCQLIQQMRTPQAELDCYGCHSTWTSSDLLHRKYPISQLEIGNADPSASLSSTDFLTPSVIDDTNLLTARAVFHLTILIDYISNCKMLIVNQFERITECHACTLV